MSGVLALLNARIVDPDGGYDGPGALLVADGVIAEVARRPDLGALAEGVRAVDLGGALLIPGLVDIRAKSGEPGSEPKETLKSLSLAAAAGGVTTLVLQPDTDPAVDDPAVADFLMRRARDIGGVRMRPAAAATRALKGERMAEIGLLKEAGCVYVTDADHPLADSLMLRRVMAYARAFGMPVANRPADPFLSRDAGATEGEFAGRLGLKSAPAAAETIMLDRDLALAELTGAQLIVDQISARGSLDRLRRAREAGVRVTATASINHLSFNTLDIGDYRTFFKLEPPLREEEDRRALLAAVAEGLVEVVVSAHAPAPAEDKRLPFDEAAPGAIGVETLLSALLTLHHAEEQPLAPLLRAVTSAPARLLGLDAGVLRPGAPADLVICDLDAPHRVDPSRLHSKSKNTPFEGRRLQGAVQATMVGGRIIHGDLPGSPPGGRAAPAASLTA